MATLAERIYERSPIFVQNAMLAMYGMNLYRLRYSGSFNQRLRELLDSQWLDAERLAALQLRRLQVLVRHAQTHVPFYRDHMRSKGARVEDVTPQSIAGILPVVSKPDINADPSRFIEEGAALDKLVRINTSGTTGSPLAFYTTRAALQENYAFFARFLRWAGVKERVPSVTFAGRIIIPKTQDGPPYWRSNPIMRNVLFSSYHLSPEHLRHYVAELDRIAPEFIDSYPSAVYTLAQFMKEQGLRLRRPLKSIVTSSETLLEHQREVIEEVFGCRVFDQYGNAEAVSFVSQCEHGTYHSNPEYGLIEVLDEHGNPARPGEPGEIVCTGFLNRAMPLIRYRIGDSAVISDERCACGRAFPVVKQLLGRVDDIIVTPEGHRVGRLDPIFKGLVSIKETQIVQESLQLIVLKIVPDRGFDQGVADQLVEELRKRVGHTIQVQVEILDSIPRTKAGKFKAVVSRVKR